MNKLLKNVKNSFAEVNTNVNVANADDVTGDDISCVFWNDFDRLKNIATGIIIKKETNSKGEVIHFYSYKTKTRGVQLYRVNVNVWNEAERAFFELNEMGIKPYRVIAFNDDEVKFETKAGGIIEAWEIKDGLFTKVKRELISQMVLDKEKKDAINKDTKKIYE